MYAFYSVSFCFVHRKSNACVPTRFFLLGKRKKKHPAKQEFRFYAQRACRSNSSFLEMFNNSIFIRLRKSNDSKNQRKKKTTKHRVQMNGRKSLYLMLNFSIQLQRQCSSVILLKMEEQTKRKRNTHTNGKRCERNDHLVTAEIIVIGVAICHRGISFILFLSLPLRGQPAVIIMLLIMISHPLLFIDRLIGRSVGRSIDALLSSHHIFLETLFFLLLSIEFISQISIVIGPKLPSSRTRFIHQIKKQQQKFNANGQCACAHTKTQLIVFEKYIAIDV